MKEGRHSPGRMRDVLVRKFELRLLSRQGANSVYDVRTEVVRGSRNKVENGYKAAICPTLYVNFLNNWQNFTLMGHFGGLFYGQINFISINVISSFYCTPKVADKQCIHFFSREGERVRESQNVVDVIYGSPLSNFCSSLQLWWRAGEERRAGRGGGENWLTFPRVFRAAAVAASGGRKSGQQLVTKSITRPKVASHLFFTPC